MPGLLPLLPPTALDYFTSLVADDASLPLLETAIAIAQHDDPGLDIHSTLAEIDALAVRLRARIPVDAAPIQRLRVLNRFFFHELGFSGNVNDYYDPRNSYIHAVLETRRGIPITLALLYVELATQIRLDAVGIAFPGHFLARVRMPKGDIVIDPVHRPVDVPRRARRSARAVSAPARPPAVAAELPLGAFLEPASPRDVIARMLRNLKEIYRSSQDSGAPARHRRAAGHPPARGLGRAARPRPGASRRSGPDTLRWPISPAISSNAPDAPDRPVIKRAPGRARPRRRVAPALSGRPIPSS